MALASTYTQIELTSIEKLRNSLADLNLDDEQKSAPHLVKWLRMCDMNVSRAEVKFRKSQIWRRENNIDEILEEWTIPVEIMKALPAFVAGYDNDGNAIVVYAMKDFRDDIFVTVDLNTAVKARAYILEKLMHDMRTRNKQLGLTGNQVVSIFDLEGLNLWSYIRTAMKRRELTKAITDLTEDNYPALQKVAYVTFAPKVITMLMPIAKQFIAKEVLKVFKIFGYDKKDWLDEMLTHIDPRQLPTRFGGLNAEFDHGYAHAFEPGYEGPEFDRQFRMCQS